METLRLYRWIGTALALAGAVATAEAQNLERMAGAAGGPVRFAYPAAENVCGTGDGVLIREPDGSTMFVSGHVSARGWREWRRGSVPCETGDVVVGLTPGRDGWEDVTMGVGVPGESEEAGGADARDLGYFTGQESADFLLVAARASDARAARDLILAAAIARDAVIWPELLVLARDRSASNRTRKTALHWLGRRAAREAVDGLGGIVHDRTEDDEIREAAVFALSQLPDDQAIPLLIELVETMDNPRVVNRALFWLAEFDDPRALAVFERILAGPGV